MKSEVELLKEQIAVRDRTIIELELNLAQQSNRVLKDVARAFFYINQFAREGNEGPGADQARLLLREFIDNLDEARRLADLNLVSKPSARPRLVGPDGSNLPPTN